MVNAFYIFHNSSAKVLQELIKKAFNGMDCIVKKTVVMLKFKKQSFDI